MIHSVKHKGLRNYWTKGRQNVLHAAWLPRIRRIRDALDAARDRKAMNIDALSFHGLSGRDAGRYCVRVAHNDRITFGWSEGTAIDIDLKDDH